MNTDEHIARAVEVLRTGGIVIYPTDTAFGIGCRIDDHAAVDRLFALRKRPVTQATPVLVASVDMALAYYDSPNDIVRRLMQQYWPGAVTIIASCKPDLFYSPIRGGGQTIGLRMPDHPTALTIISGLGIPVIGTSANFHGEPTPYRFGDLDPELTTLVDYVVPGTCSVRQASTVADCTWGTVKIVRQGSVKIAV